MYSKKSFGSNDIVWPLGTMRKYRMYSLLECELPRAFLAPLREIMSNTCRIFSSIRRMIFWEKRILIRFTLEFTHYNGP
jgi:hypothetical protein